MHPLAIYMTSTVRVLVAWSYQHCIYSNTTYSRIHANYFGKANIAKNFTINNEFIDDYYLPHNVGNITFLSCIFMRVTAFHYSSLLFMQTLLMYTLLNVVTPWT